MRPRKAARRELWSNAATKTRKVELAEALLEDLASVVVKMTEEIAEEEARTGITNPVCLGYSEYPRMAAAKTPVSFSLATKVPSHRPSCSKGKRNSPGIEKTQGQNPALACCAASWQ
jgi:hypothetical protein